ncbi:hypothetical protein PTKIN_Ptkin14bG0156900 [Pterospermum kingtungense]
MVIMVGLGGFERIWQGEDEIGDEGVMKWPAGVWFGDGGSGFKEMKAAAVVVSLGFIEWKACCCSGGINIKEEKDELQLHLGTPLCRDTHFQHSIRSKACEALSYFPFVMSLYAGYTILNFLKKKACAGSSLHTLQFFTNSTIQL